MCNPDRKDSSIYRDSLKDYWDLFSITETAEKKGRKEVIEIGREEGRKEGREEGLEKGERRVLPKSSNP